MDDVNLSTIFDHGTKSSGFLCPDMADQKRAIKKVRQPCLDIEGRIVLHHFDLDLVYVEDDTMGVVANPRELLQPANIVLILLIFSRASCDDLGNREKFFH